MNQQRTEQRTEQRIGQRVVWWPDVHINLVARVAPSLGEDPTVTVLPKGDRS